MKRALNICNAFRAKLTVEHTYQLMFIQINEPP